MPDLPSGSDLATLSLLDPEQGVCPNGHECRLDDQVGYRRCATCEYRGLALVCWDITSDAIDNACRRGADLGVLEWAHSFVGNRR